MVESSNGIPSRLSKAGVLVTVASLIAIAFITLAPFPPSEFTVPTLCVACAALAGVNLALNVALFVPLGLGLRWVTGRMTAPIVLGLLVTLTVEVLQWRTIPGRHASIDDIIANSVGTALGAWIGGELSAWWMLVGKRAARAGVRYALLATAALMLSAALLIPRQSPDAYFVQWARVLRHTDAFTGRLDWAVLNSKVLKPADVLPSVAPDGQPSQLNAGVGISGTIRPVRRRAEILRIGNQRSEAMLLGQRGSEIVFRAYTRAEHLRLRSPLIALPLTSRTDGRVNNGDSGGVVISARSTPRAIELRMVEGVDTISVTTLRSIGLAWTLVAPWEVAVGPDWGPVNAAFLAIMVLPASFFASRARMTIQPGRFTGSGSVVTMLVFVAFIPPLMGLSRTTPVEWAGVILGLVAGHALARLPVKRAAA